MAQQSNYTSERGEAICNGLAEGRSLLAVCRDTGIGYESARSWEESVPEHGANSMRARVIGCHAMADECIDIADDGAGDYRKQARGEDAALVFNVEHVQRARLRIDTRLRLLGKWLPKIYGDKLAVGGADDLPPIKAEMSDSDIARRIAFALHKGMVAAKNGGGA